MTKQDQIRAGAVRLLTQRDTETWGRVVAQLARDCRASRDTVRYTLRQMIVHGALAVTGTQTRTLRLPADQPIDVFLRRAAA